ncbi:MAG: IS4 family transposase [Myxococcota bacterium]
MRAPTTLFRYLSDFMSGLPKRLKQTVWPMIEAICSGRRLSLSGIGRYLTGKAKVKHKIKRVWRLLSNPTLHHLFTDLFASIAKMLIADDTRPVLLVDWTCFDKDHYALVAAVVHDGRALPIYVEVHPIGDYANEAVETAFLSTLKRRVVPQSCAAIICADAGFRNPWFAQVQRLGWDFVGRLCGRVTVQSIDATADIWVQRTVVMAQATANAVELGEYRVAKTNPLTARLVTVDSQTPRMPSQKRTPNRHQGAKAKKYKKQAEEPWLLITSLPASEFSAAAIVRVYSLRMQVEETFKDDKNRDDGIGLDGSRSQRIEHLRALRWLGALTTILTHTVGLVGESLGIDRDYQSNTVSDRRVLSLTFLGRQILRHQDRRCLSMKRLQDALSQIRDANDIDRVVQDVKANEERSFSMKNAA